MFIDVILLIGKPHEKIMMYYITKSGTESWYNSEEQHVTVSVMLV